MLEKKVWTSDVHYNFKYVEYLPKNFDCNQKYPLVIHLHGAGEWGDDLDNVTRIGYLSHVLNGKHYPFIIIAPQCPKNKYWGCFTESLNAFLDQKIDQLPVDKDRVYLVGHSMGGTGTWMLAMSAPQKFAAIMPICGSGIYWFGEALKKVPVYAVHGNMDDVVPICESVNMVKSVNAHGGNAKLKILEGVDHNAWTYSYQSQELLEWLLSQNRKNNI